ncbi:transglutaminase-like domain-containing protein [Sphingomonas montanisoli]|uniref:Transglutaminase family protein n=1 Tax=Sphingomonas montanisoli TaxID=2606412 RepID=A0A5D9CEL4_9SPHN|nr:transglutaminase family protein [Sphingomonas montanisoli]TZG29593.1 transglutaminase family protein [Sphingomonas montanisoli]
MKLSIKAHLDYQAERPTDLLIQIEAAMLPDQQIEFGRLDISANDHIVRVAGEAGIGERLWTRATGQIVIDYRATVVIDRNLCDCRSLPTIPLHKLPAEAVPFLMASRYCPSDRFETFIDDDFADLQGGARVIAMRDWIERSLTYKAGASNAETTAADTFVDRQGVCRDYAHLMITLARAAGIPARMASVYAPGVDPPDFHAVAEVYLGDWYLIDATGMATPDTMARIVVGRDAADIAFLSAFGSIDLNAQTVTVERVRD